MSTCGLYSVHLTGETAGTCGVGSSSGPTSFVLSSPAKLNLFLEVCGKREDGFHELETVMLRTEFCDQLSFQHVESSKVTLEFSDATPADMRCQIPLDDRNLILKAARVLKVRAGVDSGVRMILHKRIPPESGLGGGSSNAATALIGCRRLWGLEITDAELHELAASLGSDINFLLSGATAAVCRGRGEIVEPVPLASRLFFVALRPKTGNSTAAVFKEVHFSKHPRTSSRLVQALSNGETDLQRWFFNRLTGAAAKVNCELASLLTRIPTIVRRPVFMSGSGSTVFVAATCRHDAQSIASKIGRVCRRPTWILESAVEDAATERVFQRENLDRRRA